MAVPSDAEERPEREIDLLRREIDEHPERAMVVRTAPSSPDLYVVFMGKDLVRENLRRGDAAPELLADMKALSFYREAGLTSANLVMLRDYYRFFYHAGLNRDVTSIDAVIRLLASTREAMPHVRASATLGSSAGGYAAILFGHHLAVDTVFAFAPQTLIDAPKLREMSGREDLSGIPEEHRDLSILLTQHNGRTRYEVWYSRDNDEDRGFAERIGGCPGVTLHPEPGDSHFVLAQMHRGGALPSFGLGGDVSPEASGSRSG
jgi:hypothetical protein